MALHDRYDLGRMRNEAAEQVYDRVERLLEERNTICKCENCVLDLVAFTLNRVTPRFSTSVLGDLHPDEVKRKKLQVEIDLALHAGIERVQEHPHHD